MANIHILEQVGPGRFRVVYHIAIPAGNNSAGVSWRSAVALSKVDPLRPSALPDGDGTGGTISAAEKAQVVSGAVYELVAVEKGQSAATLNATYNRRASETLDDLQAELAQYGRII